MMTPERWLRLEELFGAALEMPSGDRAAYLERACAGDTGLRRQVESLIVSSQDPGGVIEAAIQDAAAQAAGTTGLAGEQIGRYRIERELGRGGMGSVYLAWRADDEYQKRVAIKLIRGGIATSDLLRRFRSERQILANLDHPNIARLLDGGTTDSGVPYVVMEYVEGEPIDEYCNRAQLTTEQRLVLFRKVCSAVQYAHQNLVVHRDIKPGNIMVAPDGEPKLLDFGIAKLLKPDDAGSGPAETRADVRLMTPEYASPEQVRGDAITTATDVYSLGVVLYELLTGERPYTFKTGQPGEIERVICEQEPTRPSTVARRLRGDLDNIVLTALRKEPQRRYSSVEQFSDDIRRHLDGLPVTTRPATLRYRAGKFVRRHRAGVSAAAAATIVIAGLVVFYTWRLAGERDRAQLEATKAARVSEFLIGLFQISDPGESRGETVTARQLLDTGAARIEKELSDQPEVQAEMMNVIGRVYSELGMFSEARPLSAKAVELRRAFHGADHAKVAESLKNLASVEMDLGDYDAATAAAVKALETSRKVSGPESTEVAEHLAMLSRIEHARGDQAKAEQYRRQSLDIYRLHAPDDDLRVVSSKAALAGIEIRKGRYDSAESLLKEAVAAMRRHFGNDHTRVSSQLAFLGDAQLGKGDYKSAAASFSEALAINRKVLGNDHPNVATSLASTGFALAGMGQYAEGEAHLREALALNIKLRGEEHLAVASNLQHLVTIVFRRGNLDDAEPLSRRAVALYRKLVGDKDERVATALTTLGSILTEKGSYREAEQSIREALQIDQALYGETHPFVADDWNRLARVLVETGDTAEAERLYRQAIAVQQKVMPPASPQRTAGLIGLGSLLVKKPDLQGAEPLLREALTIQSKALPATDWTVANAKSELAACLIALRQYAEAETLLVESHQALSAARGDSHKLTTTALDRLVSLYRAWNKTDKAAEYLAMRRR